MCKRELERERMSWHMIHYFPPLSSNPKQALQANASGCSAPASFGVSAGGTHPPHPPTHPLPTLAELSHASAHTHTRPSSLTMHCWLDIAFTFVLWRCWSGAEGPSSRRGGAGACGVRCRTRYWQMQWTLLCDTWPGCFGCVEGGWDELRSVLLVKLGLS